MDDYHFWQDLFDTYQSFPDWLQVLWLLAPLGFLLALISLWMHFRLANRRIAHKKGETLAYTVYADKTGRLRIYAHEGAPPLPVEGPQLKLPDTQSMAVDELMDFYDTP